MSVNDVRGPGALIEAPSPVKSIGGGSTSANGCRKICGAIRSCLSCVSDVCVCLRDARDCIANGNGCGWCVRRSWAAAGIVGRGAQT